MARWGALPIRIGLPAAAAVGLLLLGGLELITAGPTPTESASTVLVAVDGDITGNASRSVSPIDDCVSATAGRPAEIDIVLPSPGVPPDRGLAAYQFSILYNPAVVWIADEDSDMLLAQATGSNVIPIADPKPDSNGVYQSWGLDFGTSGIEPTGSSEIGPGVLARITVQPQSDGISQLTLSNVLLIDDAGERLSLEPAQSATLHVGQPCPVQDPQTAPPAAALTPTPTPAASTPAPAAQAPPAATQTASQPPARAVPTGGGAPPSAGDFSAWIVFSGLIATLAGAALLIAGALPFGGRARRDTSSEP